MALVDASPIEGDARERPIMVGEESAEVMPPIVQDARAPVPLVGIVANRVVESPPRPTSAQATRDGAPSGEVVIEAGVSDLSMR